MVGMKIDDVDRRILNIVLRDCRLSYRKMAKKAGVSVVTVMNRIKRMESEGVISRYAACIDYEKLGYDIEIIVDVRVSKGKLLQVEKLLASHPNVSAVYDVTGQSDVVVVGKFRTRRDMDRFIKKIQTYDFVERTNTKLILNTIKDEGAGV